MKTDYPPLRVIILLYCCLWIILLSTPVTARRGGGGGGSSSKYKTAYACEGSQLGFSCPEGQLISLIRANYGRFSISICNEHGTLDWSVDCKSNRSYNVIRESCGMRRKCSLPASTELFGDPCPGTFKYLEAHYQCIAESPTTPSSTTPSTTSTTTTTSRPVIIVPATPQFQRPPPPPAPLPTPGSHPLPVGNPAASTRGPSFGDDRHLRQDTSSTPSTARSYNPLPSTPETPAEEDEAKASRPSSRPEGPVPANGATPGPARSTTVFTLHRAPPPSPTTSGYDIWGGSWSSSTEDAFAYDSSHLGRGRFQDPDRANGNNAAAGASYLHRGFCPPMQSRSSFWNWTRAGDTAVQRCPGGAIGHAKWRCLQGNPPYWEHETPNLSACYSAWMENLKSRAEDDDSVVSLAMELEVITRTKTLLGGDIAQMAGVIQRLLGRMTRRLDEIPDERGRFQVVKELLQSTVEISSNLLEDYQRDSWLELPPRERRHVAGALLQALDNSTWLLADTKNAAFRFSRTHGNVLVSVRLVETWALSEIRFPVHEDVHGTVWMRMQDTLAFPPQALLGSARNGVVKLVFMAYRNIEDFLGPDLVSTAADSSSGERVINSRVIAASVNSRHLTKLHQPVLITFQHREIENVTNPRCVFWSFDAEDWSTDGCWLKESNETHSVCACNHLTNFALAMDRRPPQLLSTEQKLQLFVYASFATCMVLLIATGLTLQAFRSLKGERVTIHKNLCLCLLLTEALLASGLGGHPQRVVCGVLAGFLHYFWLASFFWALLEGFQLYTVLLDVLGTDPPSSRLRWYYLLAYGAPAVIVCVSAGISPSSYGALPSLAPSSPPPSFSSKACWIDMEGHQLWSFVGPAAFCAVLCLVFLALVFCKAHRRVDLHATLKSKEQERIANTRSLSVHSVLVLLCLCLASSFAQLHVSRGSVVHTSLFSVLNVLLGLAVLIFCCLRNDKVKRALCRRLPGCRLPGGSRLGGSSPGAPGGGPGPGAQDPAVGPGLFMHANGMLVPYSSTQQSWSSLKEHESSEVTQDTRNHATQGLPSIATVTSNYPCEEHPLRSWICNAWPPPASQGPPPDCLPYTAAQWPPSQYNPRGNNASDDGSWKPPDPYARNDHVYETIDEDAAALPSAHALHHHHHQVPSSDGWRTQPHQAGRHGTKQGGSYRSLGRAAMLNNSVVAPAPDRTILGSLTAALTSSPRARHLPIIGDSCLRQQVAYSGIKSPSDSERSSSSLMDEERTESSATLALEDRSRGVWSSETSQHDSDVFVREGVEHF